MYAVIDIGSNTIRLSSFKKIEENLELLFTKKESAGLAQFIDDSNNMSDEGIEKAISTLKEFSTLVSNVKFKKIYTFATAAIRNVNNSEYVVDCIEKETGLNIDILSASEESSYAYIGANKTLNIDEGLMFDLGGGSTEIVIYKNGKIRYEVSIPFGSLNIYNRYVNKILPTKKESTRIKKAFLEELKKIDYKNMDVNIDQICCVGGSSRACLQIINKWNDLPNANSTFNSKALKEVLDCVLDNKINGIHYLLKIVPDRIHTIIPGIIIINAISEYFNCNAMIVSKHGVREGFLYHNLFKE